MQETTHARYSSPVGKLTVIATQEGLAGLHWEEQKHRAHFADPGAQGEADEHPVLLRVWNELDEYFSGARTTFDVPLIPQGDAFSQSVWRLLVNIPFGETTTYGALATQLGNRHLAQRVGQAVGANPIGLIIPCHRVLGADGSLTGFAGGLEAKRWLLSHEEPHERTLERLF